MLYFAYGSNLDEGDLARFCGERGFDPLVLEPVGAAYLPDRRLAFTHRSTSRGGGVLDVPPARGRAVAGVLFRVPSDEAVAALDRKETDGHVYERFASIVLTEDGAEQKIFSYQVASSHRLPFVAPVASYLEIVRRGYRAHGLDVGPLDAAAEGRSPSDPIAGLFVYGTLRLGEERHGVLIRHGATGGERVSTIGTLFDLGAYPGLAVVEPCGTVVGELYVAPDVDALFRELDPIETFHGFGAAGSLYRRAVIRVRDRTSRSTLAWTYVFTRSTDGIPIIASGDWRRRRRP